jgi:hypothetical protein
MRYKCPHCPVECLVVDGIIEQCADHAWAVPEPILVELPIEELSVSEASDGLQKR